jgi:hypothetical protein
MTMYRRGLKENVKDELMRTGEKIDDLDDLIRATIEIDDNLYERAIERRHDVAPRGKSGFIPYHSNNRGRNNKRNQYQDPYGPMPMELDATEGRFQGNREFKDKSTMTCYGCGRKGHMARDCHSKNKVPRRQFNMTQRRLEEPRREEPEEPKPEPEKLEHDQHGRLSWTACYDDSCLIHYSSKMGSGWFPSKPKARGKGFCNVITRKDDLEEEEIEEGEVESDPEEESNDDDEESEEESSDNDQFSHPCDFENNIKVLHAYVPSCFAMMFGIMMRHGEEAFPSVNGQRFLHPQNFDRMLDQIRKAFWNHRLVVVNYDFEDFVVERPPLGSTFAPAGYIIPTGERVNKSMRDGINLLRSRYSQAQKQQQTLYERHLQDQKATTDSKGKGKVNFADSPVESDSGKE